MSGLVPSGVLMPTCLAITIRASGPNEDPLDVLECARDIALRLHDADASLTVYAGQQCVEVFALDLATKEDISATFDCAIGSESETRCFVMMPSVDWRNCDEKIVQWVHRWNDLRSSLLQRSAEATVARDVPGALLYATRAFAADVKLRAAIDRAMKAEVRGFCNHVLEHSGVGPLGSE